jgi:hypothetical protein
VFIWFKKTKNNAAIHAISGWPAAQAWQAHCVSHGAGGEGTRFCIASTRILEHHPLVAGELSFFQGNCCLFSRVGAACSASIKEVVLGFFAR